MAEPPAPVPAAEGAQQQPMQTDTQAPNPHINDQPMGAGPSMGAGPPPIAGPQLGAGTGTRMALDGEPSGSVGGVSGIPMPNFAAPTAAAHNPDHAKLWYERFERWLVVCGRGRPARDFLLLAMTEPVSQKWGSDLLRELPSADDATVRARFLERFASEVRQPATVARDRLHAGKVTQRSNQDVVDYVSMFRDVIRDLPDTSEGDRIRWFQSGLLPALRTACAVDYRGREFATLDDCIQHAYGEERKLKVVTGLSGKAIRPYAHLAQTAASPPPKKARTESQAIAPLPAGAGGAAAMAVDGTGGPSTSGAGRGGGHAWGGRGSGGRQRSAFARKEARCAEGA